MREADTRAQERSRLQAANTTPLPMRQAETAEKIIAAMLEIFRIPGAWMQSRMGCDADGNGATPFDEGTCQVCLLGGYARVLATTAGSESAETLCRNIETKRAREALRRTIRESEKRNGEWITEALANRSTITSWNDRPGRTQGEVVALLERTAEAVAGLAPVGTPTAPKPGASGRKSADREGTTEASGGNGR